jgi:SAM-dependent methyltransferase
MKCIVCQHKEFEEIFNCKKLPVFAALQPIPLSEKNRFDAVLMRCRNCGFVQQKLSSKLKKFLANFYTKEASFFTAPPTPTAPDKRTKFNISFLRHHLRGSVKSILEIGAYDGYFLNLLRKEFKAQSCVGIEILRLKNNFPGVKMIHDFYPSRKVAGDIFDVVILMNVLEHVFDPRDFMLKLHANLAEGGKILIEVPNEEHHFKAGAASFQHQHISYFTPVTAKRFLSEMGFKIDALYTKDLDRLLILCSKEKAISKKITSVDTSARGYAKRQLALVQKLKKVLESGKPSGLYGAATFTHNIVQLLDKPSSLYVFDGDSRKEGKYMSDVKNPVGSWKDIDSSGVKRVIITPLAFTPAIYKFLLSKKIKTPIVRLFTVR